MKYRILIALTLAALLLTGCQAAQIGEQVGEQIDHAADQVEDRVEDIVDAAIPTQTAKTITPEEAEAIALEHAGVTAEHATLSRTEYEVDDNAPEYEIEFRSGDTEYDYTIHAVTGEILNWDQDTDAPTPANPQQTLPAETVPAETASPAPSETLSESAAKTIALEHAGLTAEQVTFSRTEYEVDDGRPEYEIEFRSGNTEYDYTIHAETGKILDWDQDKEKDIPTVVEPAVTEPAATKLTAAEAEAIALKHAGLTAEQVTGLRSEYEVDDGRPEYEIEFRSGNTEYDYTIHAETGKILDYDKDLDD